MYEKLLIMLRLLLTMLDVNIANVIYIDIKFVLIISITSDNYYYFNE